MATQNYHIDQSNNPYYLHPTESPAQVLVTPLLNGNNYHSWARAMKLTLDTKNKLKFITGTLKQPPPDDPLHDSWKRCNNMVLSWLQRSVEESIVKSIIWIDSAAEVWKDLQDRFSQGDMFRISELLHDFYYLNQGNLTIFEYFGELKSLWEEIETFMPIPNYKCSVQCSCGVIPLVKGYREQSYVIRFLKGLNEQYAPVRSQIMLLDPLPSISKAFSLLSQQERQSNIPSIHEPDPQNRALTLSTNQDSYKSPNNDPGNNLNFRGRGGNAYRGNKPRFNGAGRNQGNKFCTHCQRTNHTIETCFIKHGYPPGFQNNRFTKMANHTIGFPLDQSNEDSELQTTKSGQGANKLFADEQVQGILDLMHNAKAGEHTVNSAIHTKASPTPPPGNIKTCWIMDTGATDHIINNIHNFSDLQIHSTNVHHPT
ncbi:PREDICTED: uncharacterized protein LOC109337640 [Lupinus angustifolius]|uniref:uncharacterized protein LOC109337640 n=1 Tax=Lupinus angustifolius TaxID=3871 RepID=UPI00092E5E77|nr:PREDICTED: uncharacterized protein LOC109337640 [Lupinus angustifolius]